MSAEAVQMELPYSDTSRVWLVQMGGVTLWYVAATTFGGLTRVTVCTKSDGTVTKQSAAQWFTTAQDTCVAFVGGALDINAKVAQSVAEGICSGKLPSPFTTQGRKSINEFVRTLYMQLAEQDGVRCAVVEAPKPTPKPAAKFIPRQMEPRVTGSGYVTNKYGDPNFRPFSEASLPKKPPGRK